MNWTSAHTHGSERTVTLPDRLLELLAAHIEHHLENDDPDGWLYRSPNGTPPHQNTVGHQWRKTARASGLEGCGCTTRGTTTPRV